MAPSLSDLRAAVVASHDEVERAWQDRILALRSGNRAQLAVAELRLAQARQRRNAAEVAMIAAEEEALDR